MNVKIVIELFKGNS